MKLRKTSLKFLLAAVSGVLMFLSFPAFNLYYLGWISFIPLLLALEEADLFQAYLLGLVCGLTGISGGFYWVADWARIALEIPPPFNFAAIPLFSLYSAQIFALTCLFFQYLRRLKILDDVFLFPVVQVSVFSLFPLLFDFRMGDGQTYFLAAIQAIEYTGVYGIDFILALVNVVLYKALSEFAANKRAIIVGVIIASVWFGYGIFSLERWDDKIASLPKKKIGLVQPNRPASLAPQKSSERDRLYPPEMEISQSLAKKGAELIVWPEGHFFYYAYRRDIREAFNLNIKKMGVPVIFYDATYEIRNNQRHVYNTSIWVDRNGEFRDQYHKIKLVPFGEYTPLIGDIAFIKELLGGFLTDLSRGTEHKAFETAGMRIVPKMCYESIFPELTAQAIGGDGRGKALLVQTQNGWYGETNQPEEHMAISALRAVENRTPLIHVINNGPSAVVTPQGRYAFMSPAFTRGGWIAETPFDPLSGGSFYSKHPFLFINIIRMFFILLSLWAVGGKIFFSFKEKASRQQRRA